MNTQTLPTVTIQQIPGLDAYCALVDGEPFSTVRLTPTDVLDQLMREATAQKRSAHRTADTAQYDAMHRLWVSASHALDVHLNTVRMSWARFGNAATVAADLDISIPAVWAAIELVEALEA